MEIIRCQSPLRISFAGGGTDVPTWAIKYGGQVISTTIDKYIFVTINPIETRTIKVIAHDLNKTSEFSLDDLCYNGDSDIIKAVIKYFKINKGYCISIHCDLPAGSGMGTSSSLAVALIKGISLIQNQELKPYDVAKIACYIERDELKEAGGYQDQYAAAMGGFNFMKFSDTVNVYPLKLSPEFLAELNYRLILCYTGKTHISKEIHNIMITNHGKIQFEEGMIALKQYASDVRDIIQSNDINQLKDFGKILHKAWIAKQQLSDKISNPDIEKIYSFALQNGAEGGKLLGAGGGGYLLLYVPPKNRMNLIQKLRKIGLELVDFHFETDGVKAWSSPE